MDYEIKEHRAKSFALSLLLYLVFFFYNDNDFSQQEKERERERWFTDIEGTKNANPHSYGRKKRRVPHLTSVHT